MCGGHSTPRPERRLEIAVHYKETSSKTGPESGVDSSTQFQQIHGH